MLGKIYTQMNEFTNNVKTTEGLDELLSYMNSSLYSSIKLLVFSSKTFAIYGRVMLFFIIVLTSILVSTSIGAFGNDINIVYLSAITILLYFSLITYVNHFKNALVLSIEMSKISMKKVDK